MKGCHLHMKEMVILLCLSVIMAFILFLHNAAAARGNLQKCHMQQQLDNVLWGMLLAMAAAIPQRLRWIWQHKQHQSRVAIAVEEDCLSPPTHSVASEEIHLETATTAYALNWLHTCTDMLCRLFF